MTRPSASKTSSPWTESLQQFEAYEADCRGFSRVAEFINKLVSHYVFDDGNLVVAHAGMKEAMQVPIEPPEVATALYHEITELPRHLDRMEGRSVRNTECSADGSHYSWAGTEN